MSGRSDRIRELYEAALKRPIGERAAFVAAQTKDDRDLRQRVEALLAGQHDTQIAGYESSDGDSAVLATGTRDRPATGSTARSAPAAWASCTARRTRS